MSWETIEQKREYYRKYCQRSDVNEKKKKYDREYRARPDVKKRRNQIARARDRTEKVRERINISRAKKRGFLEKRKKITTCVVCQIDISERAVTAKYCINCAEAVHRYSSHFRVSSVVAAATLAGENVQGFTKKLPKYSFDEIAKAGVRS